MKCSVVYHCLSSYSEWSLDCANCPLEQKWWATPSYMASIWTIIPPLKNKHIQKLVPHPRTLVNCHKIWNPLQLRHNEHDSISNHRRFDCLLSCLFRRRSKKKSKLRVTGLCAGNSPVTGEYPAQRASNAENVSIWRRHHVSHTWPSVGLWPELQSHLNTEYALLLPSKQAHVLILLQPANFFLISSFCGAINVGTCRCETITVKLYLYRM